MSDGFKGNKFTSGEVFGHIYYIVVKNVKVELQKKVKKIDGVLGTVSEKIKELSNKSKSNAKTDKGILGTFLGELGNWLFW